MDFLNEIINSEQLPIYVSIGIICIIIIVSVTMGIHNFFKKAGVFFETTPFNAFLIILTFPISIPIYVLWIVAQFLFKIFKPLLREFLFLILGVFKILKNIVSGIIQLGKGGVTNSSDYNSDQEYYDTSIDKIKDCFNILGLSSNSSSDEIVAAYRQKIKEYHPDKVANLGEKLKKLADSEAKKLNVAYAMLKDNGYV
jgi:hypothetical protein